MDPLRADLDSLDPSDVRPSPERPTQAHLSLTLEGTTVDGDELAAFITAYAQLLRLTRSRRLGVWAWRSRLPEGRAAWPHLLGQLIEHYHYIDGAAAKHATMLLSPQDRRCYLAARRHLADEAEHADLVVEALRRWPGGPVDPSATRPLTATSALLAWQAHVGLRWGPVGFFAAASLAEVHADIAARTPNPWSVIASRCDVDPHVVAPLAEHFDMDRAAGHGSTIETLLAGRQVAAGLAVEYVATLPSADDALGIWHGKVIEHYHLQARQPLPASWPFTA